MIVHNASDKFIRIHAPRLASAVRKHVDHNNRRFYIATIEDNFLAPEPTDVKQVRKGGEFFAIQFECIDYIPEIVLTPATEQDLEMLEKWEARNAAKFGD